MRVFVVDNYDSFTYNVVSQFAELGAEIDVARNDEIGVESIARREPHAVVISPGPGDPSTAGITVDVVKWCASTRTPLLGVCLGHQAIAVAFGGRTVRAASVMHGKTSEVHHDNRPFFRGLPDPFVAMRYHSLTVDERSLPSDLVVSARTADGIVMGVAHRSLPINGVQFHPESILTAHGKRLVGNFLAAARPGYEFEPTVISTV